VRHPLVFNAISRLREALGDTARHPRFIETIPRHGYRFLPEVVVASPTPRTTTHPPWLFAAGVTLLAALAVGLFLRFDRVEAHPIHSLAVLPFRDLGTGKQDDYFAAGMTDAVTTELAKLGVSKVTSETSVEKFQNTKETVPQIAHVLGVDAVVEGAVLQEGDRVRITVQLIRGDTDRHIWAQSYERELTNVLALQDQVALGVAQAIDLRLAPGAAISAVSRKQVNPDAYQDYLKGRYCLQQRSDEFYHAKDYFEAAIQSDPNYAPAYAGLSQYYWLGDALSPQEALPEAKRYAQEALRLDPDLPEGHLDLAAVDFYFDWNWAGADQEFKRAIALAPASASAHYWYAMYLGAMGRYKRAMAEAQRTADLDPLSILSHSLMATAAASLGEYDRALEQTHEIAELDPSSPWVCNGMFLVDFPQGKYKDSLTDADKCLALTHRDPAFLMMAALADVHMGDVKQASRLVAEMKADSRHRYVSPTDFAEVFTCMGKKNEAMAAFEKGYKLHDSNMVSLNSDPVLRPLDADPRFQTLLREMNFPVPATAGHS
jgi:TolB-like protein/Tfp pilus assembly protein PilF